MKNEPTENLIYFDRMNCPVRTLECCGVTWFRAEDIHRGIDEIYYTFMPMIANVREQLAALSASLRHETKAMEECAPFDGDSNDTSAGWDGSPDDASIAFDDEEYGFSPVE